MKAVSEFEPEFVVSMPQPLQHGVLYVSMEFATVIHLCACGCGNKVVTPLKVAGWELRYNGEGISLYPSVGCWSFPCRSHYWIKRNQVVWSNQWSEDEIRNGREETTRLNVELQKLTNIRKEIAREEPKHKSSAESSCGEKQISKSWITRLIDRLMIWK